MIDKKQLMLNGREDGKSERVYLTVLTDAEKDIYLSNRFSEQYKKNTILKDWFETIWEVATCDSVLTFCVWDNTLDKYIGYCNYNSLNRDVAALGIELIEEYQNKGYGYEVCKLLLDMFFAKTDEPYIHYESFRSNEHSRHLGEKLGGILLNVNQLLSELEETNRILQEKDRLDCRMLDIFTYAIYRP